MVELVADLLVIISSATLVQQITGNFQAALAFVKTIRPTALAAEVPQVERHLEQQVAQPLDQHLAQPLEQIPEEQTHTRTTLLVLFHKTGVFNIQVEFLQKIAQALMLRAELTSLHTKQEKLPCRFKGRRSTARLRQSLHNT